MKFPNLRLYDTQAKFAIILGVLGLLSIGALAYLVFHGYNPSEGAIYYRADAGLGRHRMWFVRGATGASVMIGALAAILGFNSLGQKRNKFQKGSWSGLIIGSFTVSMAGVLYYAWDKLNTPI